MSMKFDRRTFVQEVHRRVRAYGQFLDSRGVSPDVAWEELPLLDRHSYLLRWPVEDLCWDGSLADCHVIRASAGHDPSRTVFWPRRPQDEQAWTTALEQMLVSHHQVDRRRTLLLVCLAFGFGIRGMELAFSCRQLALEKRFPLTVSTPGLNLAEAVEVCARFGKDFEQVVWITNPSSVQLIATLIARRNLQPPPGQMSFMVMGEYYSERFRDWVGGRFGHPPDSPFCLWTTYGAADTGDVAMETRETIALRRFFSRRPPLSRDVFGTENPPILLAPVPDVTVEEIDGRIVVSRDQLIPLVRYDTGDPGGLIGRERLVPLAELPAELLAHLPERVLYIYGRPTDSVVLYGIRTRLSDLNDFLLSLKPDLGYAGLFQLRQDESDGIPRFVFTVYVLKEPSEALRDVYQREFVSFLRERNREFAARYEALTASVGESLIRVVLEDAARLAGTPDGSTLVPS